MSIDVRIVGPGGQPLKVNGEGELTAAIHTHPPADEKDSGIPIIQDMKNSSNVSDMKVVGTLASPQRFYIEAVQEYDIYIKTMQFTIADASATLSKFGNVTALTNGCRLVWLSQDLGENVIKDSMKTNWDFVKLARGVPAFGDGAGAFRASNVSGTSEGYVPMVDFQLLFGSPWGLRLRKGTKDRIELQIRDTTTGVDEFTAVCSGMKF